MRDEMVALLPELGRFASSLTQRWDKSEDLLHDTIVRALAAEHTFVDGTNLRAWLFTIMRNTWLNSKRPSVDAAYYVAPDDHLLTHILAADVRRARDDLMAASKVFPALPYRAQQVIRCSLKYETNHAEMAAALHVKAGTVKSRLNRARTELRRTMG
jgi:RNA polymerase sigma-70 factor (ECF subfamily)